MLLILRDKEMDSPGQHMAVFTTTASAHIPKTNFISQPPSISNKMTKTRMVSCIISDELTNIQILL